MWLYARAVRRVVVEVSSGKAHGRARLKCGDQEESGDVDEGCCFVFFSYFFLRHGIGSAKSPLTSLTRSNWNHSTRIEIGTQTTKNANKPLLLNLSTRSKNFSTKKSQLPSNHHPPQPSTSHLHTRTSVRCYDLHSKDPPPTLHSLSSDMSKMYVPN